MKNKRSKIITYIISGIFIVAFLFGYFFLLERDKAKRIERNILEFQTEYKEYLSKDNNVDMTFLEKISKSEFLKSTALAEHFEKIKTDTFKNFKNDYLKQIYNYNFLKNQNISNYETKNKEEFKKLVSENNELISKLEDNNNIEDLTKLKSNNHILLAIVRAELNSDKVIINEFKLAKDNQGTTNTMIDNCFDKQVNNIWKYDVESSKKMCYQLGLGSCNKIFAVTKDKDSTKQPFVGFTMNNPKKVAAKNPYVEYVSFSNNDFREFNSRVFTDIEDKYTVYPEVYYQEIMGRKIYKYNVVALPITYELSCKKPK